MENLADQENSSFATRDKKRAYKLLLPIVLLIQRVFVEENLQVNVTDTTS
jgi:hypothetical protein